MAQSISQESIALTGLIGAQTAVRYVGGTVNGAPTAGTFQVGDFVIDQTATVWVCTAAGSPGTWWSTISNHLALRSATATAKVNEVTIFTGSSTGQTITAPPNPQDGAMWSFINRSTNNVTLGFGSNSMIPLGSGTGITNYTVNPNEAYSFINYGGGQWYMTTANGTDHLVGILATANGGTGLSGFTAANNALYSTSASALTAGTLPILAGGTGTTTSTGSGSVVLATSPTVVNATANPSSTTGVGLIIKGLASQTGDLLDIQNSAGTNLISVSSAGVITLNSQKITGLANGTTSSDAVAYGQISGFISSTSPSLTNASISTTATTTVPLTINGIASQTADLFDVKNSAGTLLFGVSSSGAVTGGTYNGLTIGSSAGSLTVSSNTAVSISSTGAYAVSLTATNSTSLNLPPSGTLISTTTTLSGGDLTGTLPSPTVTQIQGKAVSTTQATVLSNSGTTASRSGVAGGTSTSTSSTGLGASVSWTVNQYAGYTVISGTSTGIVASNTSNTLTLNANGWIGGTPTSGQAFYLAQTAGAGETTVATTTSTYLALPIAPPNGTINTIVNTQSNAVTLWRNGSDVINVGSTPTNTAITVNTYQNISLIYYSGVWYTYSGYFSTTGTGAQVYGTRPNLASPYELVSINTATTLGTGTPAALNGATALPYLYTTNPNGSYAINLTNAPTTAGYSATYVLMVANGATAYLPSSITINTYATSASGLPAQATPYTSTYTTTTYYQGATVWTAADASTLDIYTITVICTSTNNYTMLLTLAKY